jgi:hypothetical protein
MGIATSISPGAHSMPQDVQIQCINKPDRANHYERIQNIGGVGSNGRWKISEDDGIAYIKSGTYTFYTMVNSARAKVYVAHHALLGREYLTTRPDDYRSNNLLYLPECP